MVTYFLSLKGFQLFEHTKPREKILVLSPKTEFHCKRLGSVEMLEEGSNYSLQQFNSLVMKIQRAGN